jgi:predicted ribosomally synthesized peptide with nif11-like leader
MSVQAAKDFIEKIKSDHKVRDEAAEGKDLVHLGHKHGFTFDRKDFDKAMEEHRHEHPEDGPDTCVLF